MAGTRYARPRKFASQPRPFRWSSMRPEYISQRGSRPQGPRPFSSSTRRHQQSKEYKESFGTRLRKALAETKIKWYPIPVALGIAFLGVGHFYRVNERERARRIDEESDDGEGVAGRPKRRERIRPTGPWLVVFIHSPSSIN
jgi:phosphatidylserine decarboxylase